MDSRQVQPSIVTKERVRSMLDELGLSYGEFDQNGFILPYPSHYAIISRGPTQNAVWSVQSHWMHKLDISYMSLAKNQIQRQAATEFAPKMTLQVADDGMIHFRVFWAFNWTPAATDDQMRDEFRVVMNSLTRTFKNLNKEFPDPWQQEAVETP
ncbi:MAG: hypothetical protein ACOX5I_01545 [Gleimia sp.]